MDQGQSEIQRGHKDDLPESRAKAVSDLCDEIKEDLKNWQYAFERMRQWRRFARGYQWPGTTKEELADGNRRYTVNITMRHVQQRTAAIYAKNPRFQWRKAKRKLSSVWDGTSQQLQLAMETLQADQSNAYAAQIMQDAVMSRQKSQELDAIGETVSILYEQQIGEQIYPTKKMMKKQVRAALTCGVAYFKQTFQRATELSPDGENAIADHMSRIAEIERIASDMQDGEIQDHDAEIDSLKHMVQSIEQTEQVILRQGIALDYPDSTAIIPDRNMTYLPGFVGCDRVSEQYELTRDQVKTIYGVDVTGATEYKQKTEGQEDRDVVRVYESWNRKTGLVCTICDGHNDYLVEPAEPPVYTERFFPWFALAPNAVDDDEDPFPPSDVELMMAQQMEINRAGEGLRQHRKAARPGHVASQNIPDSDQTRISNRNAHDVVTLATLAPGQSISDVLQPIPTSPIDPNLYNTGPAFTDVLRAVGTQEANLGGTSAATATESSIAESSRQSVLASTMDEFDDLLTEMARAGAQILFAEFDTAQVMEIVGPGAVWPEMNRDQIAREVDLEVIAGSSGLQNQAIEVQVRERLTPLLMQLPGVNPEWVVKDLLRIMDDKVNYEDAVQMGALSITAMNGQLQGQANRGAMPEAQGGQGAMNAPQPTMPPPTGPQPPQSM